MVAVGSDHAHVQGVVGGHQGDAHHGLHHRDGAALRQLQQLVPGVGQPHAAAGADEGLLGPGDGLHHPLDLQVVALDAGLIAPDVHRLRVLEFFQSLLLYVDGDVDEHRAGAAGGGDVKGLLYHTGDVIGVLHQIAVLGEGGHGSGDVHLLKDVPAQQVAGHLAGDGHHGDGVHVGGGDAGDQVGGPRAAGHHAHPHFSAHAGVARGHVPRVLLGPHQGIRDLRVLLQGVHRRADSRSRVSKHVLYILSLQALDQSLRSIHHTVTSANHKTNRSLSLRPRPAPDPAGKKQKRPRPISFDRTKPYIYSVVPPNFTGRACALIAPITVGLRPRLLRRCPVQWGGSRASFRLGPLPGASTDRSLSVRPDPLTSRSLPWYPICLPALTGKM